MALTQHQEQGAGLAPVRKGWGSTTPGSRGSPSPRSDPVPALARPGSRPAPPECHLLWARAQWPATPLPPSQLMKGLRKRGITSRSRTFQLLTDVTAPCPPAPRYTHYLPGHGVPHSPPVEGSRSKDRDSEPLEEKAESTDDTPDSLLPLLADGSRDSEALRLSSPGPSSVWEEAEPSCDSSSDRLSSLSKAGAEARWTGVDLGACEDGQGQRAPGEALAAARAGGGGGRVPSPHAGA